MWLGNNQAVKDYHAKHYGDAVYDDFIDGTKNLVTGDTDGFFAKNFDADSWMRLFKEAGVEFGYLYRDELYSGALVYDEGIDSVFEMHARRVYERFKKHGVQKVITVDPHSTSILRTAYPKIINGFDLEVKSYLEVLGERAMEPAKKLNRELVIHDSCVYSRYEDIVAEPRALLERAGVSIQEPELSGKQTHCCGGPAESLSPSTAKAIAQKRLAQLQEAGQSVVAMCPICLLNLKEAADGASASVDDISTSLAEAYCRKR